MIYYAGEELTATQSRTMKKFFAFSRIDVLRVCAACAVLFSLGAADAVAAGDWLANFEDVPQMNKVYVIVDDGFLYSVPDGKIIQTTIASDDVSRRQFQRFYRDALYELGWKNTHDDRKLQTFERGNDILSIEILETDPLKARFTMKPKE